MAEPHLRAVCHGGAGRSYAMGELSGGEWKKWGIVNELHGL